MDLWKRGVWAYVALTIAFLFMAEGMKANGGADPENAVWLVIYYIRNFLLCSWVFIGTWWLVFLWEAEQKRRQEAYRQHVEGKEREAKEAWAAVRRELDGFRSELQRLPELERQLLDRDRRRRQDFERLVQELETKQTRTSEAAVQAALEDFE